MGLFRRRSSQPDPSISLSPADAQLLAQLRKRRTDLSRPRHVLHYSYFPSREAAQLAATAAGERGWSTEFGEPLEGFPDQWSMRAERPDVVLSDEVVMDSTAFFEGVAAKHNGEYDGWEAAAD